MGIENPNLNTDGESEKGPMKKLTDMENLNENDKLSYDKNLALSPQVQIDNIRIETEKAQKEMKELINSFQRLLDKRDFGVENIRDEELEYLNDKIKARQRDYVIMAQQLQVMYDAITKIGKKNLRENLDNQASRN